MGHFLQCHTTQQHCLLFHSTGVHTDTQTHEHTQLDQTLRYIVILNEYNKEWITTGAVCTDGEIQFQVWSPMTHGLIFCIFNNIHHWWQLFSMDMTVYDCVWVSGSDLILKMLLLKIFKPDPTSICVVERKSKFVWRNTLRFWEIQLLTLWGNSNEKIGITLMSACSVQGCRKQMVS